MDILCAAVPLSCLKLKGQRLFRDGATISDYARAEGISAQGAGERLQRGYAILRKDPSIIAIALAAERTPADAYKATERRLYALPILREKLKRDRKRLPELNGIARADLESVIAVDADEVKTLDHALADCAGDAYYQTVTGRYFDGADDEQVAKLLGCETVTVWRHRKRLAERIAVWLYGAVAEARGSPESGRPYHE